MACEAPLSRTRMERGPRAVTHMSARTIPSVGWTAPFGPGVDSYNRLSTVLRNRAAMGPLDWFRQLGASWPSCDNIAEYLPVLRSIFQSATRAELDAMMTADELTQLAALPLRIVVWRGCYSVNRPGLCWSLDRSVAARFPMFNRYRRPNEIPILRRGWVNRDRVVLLLDRGEAEIIAPKVFGITEYS
jgi:hypothetical protein